MLMAFPHIFKFGIRMFKRGFLIFQELETYLRDSASSALLSQIISKTVCHPICKSRPPSNQYQRLFLSELIKRHETTASEPLDELYDALAEVLRLEEQAQCHKSYRLPTGDFVSLIENQAVISEGTTGLVTWEAALCLAEWAMEHTDIFQGRSILELGSGMGLTGITVCKMCRPHKYIFSDCHPNVLRQLQRNLSLNNLAIQEFASTGASNTSGVQIMVKNLDWEVASQEHFKDLCVDVVIASDVVYDPEIVPCLVKLLSQFLICAEKDKVPNMYIASTIRNHETYASFRRELEASGIRQNIIPGPRRRVFPYDRSSQIELIKLHL
ncbi:protein-lysine N-methyltransferase EEF2KMT isoform X2 [Erpetoichthys calabaricus]|uniref:protein-lysine N-methyltransferase EEF2KMT isoform X2 n=1 Tax=Erpetoichthys calabaricus TaxID=27687 RepID=UPI00223471D9|nr:protein-lysine N-methyltransferase EEF2KMT isoform X2 [Erpetoichthys calabaricus]